MPELESTLLLEFSWGDKQAHFTSFNRDITEGLLVWKSTPVTKVDFISDQSGVKSKDIKIKIKSDVEPIKSVLALLPVGATTLKIYEFNPQTIAVKTLRYILKVKTITSNIDGDQGISELECGTVLDQLTRPLGLPLGNYCPWRFGDLNCKKDTSQLIFTTTIENITSNRIVIANKIQTAGDYARGSLTHNSINLLILGHPSSDTLVMSTLMPVAWVGDTITIQAGCPKRLEDCVRWNNTQNFGGVGRRTPKYHPIYEVS